MPITIRPVTPTEHAAFVSAEPSVSYLHGPEWASTKSAGQATALGFFDGDRLVGVGLAQFLKTFAGRKACYLPDGPHVRWAEVDADEVLAALEGYLREAGCFDARIGPFVRWRTWSNETLKVALAQGGDVDLRRLPADNTDQTFTRVVEVMRRRGWGEAAEANTDDGQNGFNFWIDVDRPAPQILADMNQMYRRNIKKAQKAGVVVRQGGAADLPTFHALFRASAEREGFFVLPLAYFQAQFRAYGDDPGQVRVFVAELDGEPLAASVWVKVGEHVWYTRGGSSDTHRDARAVNLLQWAMIEAAHDAGAKVYDMGGIYPTIDDRSRGLLQFKVGTGGYGVANLGEWRKDLNPLIARAARLTATAVRAVRKRLSS